MPENGNRDSKTGSSRRKFLETLGKFSFFAGLGGIVMSTMRFMLPNVLYEPPTIFTVGGIEDFPADSVTFLDENRLFIFRTQEGFYAVSSICSHLGCNVMWKDDRIGFDCPCHGSTFDKNGKTISGPAPKPLKWYELTLTSDDRLQVNTRKEVDKNFRLMA
jgi:Rieske Fe-S protein